MRKTLLILPVGLILLLLGGCAGGSGLQATPTALGAVDAGLRLIQQDMILRVTQQSIENERIEAGSRMTATQQVLDAASTQQTHQEHLKETQAAAAFTQNAWVVTVDAGHARDTATAQAQGTGTAQAIIGLTATIAARQTTTSEFKTQQAPILEAQNKVILAKAESAAMAAERERMTNGVIAWGPWIVVLIVVCIIGFVVYRKSQVGTIERDSNGMMPGIVIFHKGRKMLFSLDRMFSPVLEIGQDGVSAPQLTDLEHQENTTRRAQAVQAIHALPQQAQKQGMNLMAQTFNTGQRPSIEVLEPGQVSGWVDEAENKLGEEL